MKKRGRKKGGEECWLTAFYPLYSLAADEQSGRGRNKKARERRCETNLL